MDNSKYSDTPAAVQVLGCLISNPNLLDDEGRYFLTIEDFTKEFHQILFAAISNLYTMGTRYFSAQTLDKYFQDKPVSYATFKANDGIRFIKTIEENADVANFDYYYDTVKKFTLLREYANIGYDVSWIYDPDELNQETRERKTEYFNRTSVTEIADQIEEKINRVRATYVDNTVDETVSASVGIDELFASLEETPDVGLPMYGHLVNSITRGMRLGKVYMRSAATGVGKSRTMVADFCNCACDKIYIGKPGQDGEWVDNGEAVPALFISTELEIDELQTMMVAFLTGINENYILNNTLGFAEREVVKEAIELIKRSPLYIEVIPDFNLKDIENCIKRNLRVNHIQYYFYDYIHTSMKMLEEITRRSGGIKLREDNILFLFGVKLKELAVNYNIFIITSTQLNQGWKSDDKPDQNLLRGAKSLADKIDTGEILLDVTPEDLDKLQNILGDAAVVPNVKMSIYKNRRGEYSKCFLWMLATKSTCRFDGLFLTDWNYELIPINEMLIKMR